MDIPYISFNSMEQLHDIRSYYLLPRSIIFVQWTIISACLSTLSYSNRRLARMWSSLSRTRAAMRPHCPTSSMGRRCRRRRGRRTLQLRPCWRLRRLRRRPWRSTTCATQSALEWLDSNVAAAFCAQAVRAQLRVLHKVQICPEAAWRPNHYEVCLVSSLSSPRALKCTSSTMRSFDRDPPWSNGANAR